jgi:hypothetical protein
MSTAGTTGTSSASGYLLSGGQADTLKGLQNQRVEIRGTFQDSATSGASTAGAATSTGAAMRTLRITSIRPVPGDCGAQQ